MSRSVLDASALLAYLFGEAGEQSVAEALTSGASMCTVNFSEVLAKLNDRGIRVDVAINDLATLGVLDTIDFVDFSLPLAEEAARLRETTRGWDSHMETGPAWRWQRRWARRRSPQTRHGRQSLESLYA